MTLIAKSVIKNKCWVVEKDGTKVATILTTSEGVSFVRGEERDTFPSLKLLSDRFNIDIDKAKPLSKDITIDKIYEFPCGGKIFNELWDVKKKLPIFTQEEKSKSFHCAGYYILKLTDKWSKSFCPKMITINRYEYQGPFKTKEDMMIRLRNANGVEHAN